ncbi:MAG: hypothetical protein J2P43_05720 [Candidatus Dormibacteraeota bacterium]|nr:hypothetical protein [Candidatus Dormibacteraeota bacterium]
MPSTEVTLSPPRQARVAGITVGTLWIGSDASDPQAGVGVFNPETKQPEMHRVRAGDTVTVAGRTLQVDGISVGDRAQVRLTVSWTE